MPTDKSRKGLGKGLEILVPVGVDIVGVTANTHERIHKLALDIVVPKQDQPRKSFDTQALDELAQSIRTHGILQPIIVMQVEHNLYSIIAGERRWRAARIAGLTDIPAIIRSATEHERLELALLENVQRTDLTPLELALTIERLHTQFAQSYEDIAKRLGKAHTTVLNTVRLLGLPLEMQESLQNGTISEGHARSLLALQKYPKAQKMLFTSIVSKRWTTRQAEQFVVAIKRGKKSKDDIPTKPKQVSDKVTNQIQKHLGAKKVLLHRSAKGSGKIIITYNSEDELTKIVNLILGN